MDELKEMFDAFFVAGYANERDREPTEVHRHRNPDFIKNSTAHFRFDKKWNRVEVYGAVRLRRDKESGTWFVPEVEEQP